MEDKYHNAWYELGSPISYPFLKYLVAVIQYFIDNYFLIKNLVNVFRDNGESSVKDTDKIWIACSTVGLHIISSFLISVLDSFNKEATGSSGIKNGTRRSAWTHFFRTLAHLTLTMKLFRYTTSFLENRRNNAYLHTLRMRRTPLSKSEIQSVVDQKKNDLVESHYDMIEAFFKTVPAALLQVFFMFETTPDAKLRLYSTTDQDRFATVFFTIISAAVTSANYQANYMMYKKSLHFQDFFTSRFRHDMNLQIPNDISFVASIIAQILTIGIRICFYSVILFWSPSQFLITILLLLTFDWLLIQKWSKTAWRFRAVLENPLYGAPWISFDLIDLWINIFVPGVHYPKPLDYFLNFYTTTIIGLIVFQGLDFLNPITKFNTTSVEFMPKPPNDIGVQANETFRSMDGYRLVHGGLMIDLGDTYNASFLNPSRNPAESEDDSAYFVGKIVNSLFIIHDYLTLNQMSYVEFFYKVVKYMNFVNLFCLIYTFVMNGLKIYDLDFPIQIANSFMSVVLKSLNSSEELTVENNDNSIGTQSKPTGLLEKERKAELYVIFMLLPNNRFFGKFPLCGNITWKNFDDEKVLIVQSLLVGRTTEAAPEPLCTRIGQVIIKMYKFCAPVLYPERYRDPNLNWDVSTEMLAIENSLGKHRLRSQLVKLIKMIYPETDADMRLLLAVFCAHYDEIVRHFTSLRIKRTFEFLEIPLERDSIGDGARNKKFYEFHYLKRIGGNLVVNRNEDDDVENEINKNSGNVGTVLESAV